LENQLNLIEDDIIITSDILKRITGMSGMKLDTKTDLRVCSSSDILLCKIEPKRNGYRSEKGHLYVNFTTIYIPELSIYYTTWAIREGNTAKNEQHRLEIVEWDGGLPITIKSMKHLKEAIDNCVSLIASKAYEQSGAGDYAIEPVAEFKQAFIDSGWQETSTT
jgi:hypothetical protein